MGDGDPAAGGPAVGDPAAGGPAVGDPAAGDHVRPSETESDGPVSDGVYRVVGTSEDSVTVLLVGDAAGRRINSGEVVTVAREDLAAFEPAENPDGNRSLGAKLVSQFDARRLSLWLLARSIRTRPIPGGVAIALILVGVFGEGVVPGRS